MTTNFDPIAPLYDPLVRLVFGKSLSCAQSCYLDKIPDGSHLLIAGGGSGNILLQLDRLQRSFTVDYVEMSSQMMTRARKRRIENSAVRFIQQDIFEVQLSAYDVIITPFFLDCFSNTRLSQLIDRLSACLNPDGLWLFTDFENTPGRRNQLLVKTMYKFFRLVSRLEADRLPDFKRIFQENGLYESDSHLWKGGLIVSRIYRPA